MACAVCLYPAKPLPVRPAMTKDHAGAAAGERITKRSKRFAKTGSTADNAMGVQFRTRPMAMFTHPLMLPVLAWQPYRLDRGVRQRHNSSIFHMKLSKSRCAFHPVTIA